MFAGKIWARFQLLERKFIKVSVCKLEVLWNVFKSLNTYSKHLLSAYIEMRYFIDIFRIAFQIHFMKLFMRKKWSLCYNITEVKHCFYIGPVNIHNLWYNSLNMYKISNKWSYDHYKLYPIQLVNSSMNLRTLTSKYWEK